MTSKAYRFRARPWDSEGAGSICTLCPAQCNASFTVRDERVYRVLSRENHEVDDGWLCDKGRFAYQAIAGAAFLLARDGDDWSRRVHESLALVFAVRNTDSFSTA